MKHPPVAIVLILGLLGQLVMPCSGLASPDFTTSDALLPMEEEIVLAGGCFWCLESDLEKLPGVIEAVSGYSGGTVENPSYRMVSSGTTGHLEVVKVTFDPQLIPLPELLKTFWRNIDPLDGGGQFCDRGEQYSSAIFAGTEAQQQAAEASLAVTRQDLDGQPVATTIRPAAPFYPAEEYHQDYARKNRVTYNYYRWRCGRDRRLREVWSDKEQAGVTGVPEDGGVSLAG